MKLTTIGGTTNFGLTLDPNGEGIDILTPEELQQYLDEHGYTPGGGGGGGLPYVSTNAKPLFTANKLIDGLCIEAIKYPSDTNTLIHIYGEDLASNGVDSLILQAPSQYSSIYSMTNDDTSDRRPKVLAGFNTDKVVGNYQCTITKGANTTITFDPQIRDIDIYYWSANIIG